jgi:hypothetical protein
LGLILLSAQFESIETDVCVIFGNRAELINQSSSDSISHPKSDPREKSTKVFFNLLHFHNMSFPSPMEKLAHLRNCLQDIINQHAEAISYRSDIVQRLDWYEESSGLVDHQTWNSISHTDIKADIQELLSSVDSLVANQVETHKALHAQLETFANHLKQVTHEVAAEQVTKNQQSRSEFRELQHEMANSEIYGLKAKMSEMEIYFERQMEEMKRHCTKSQRSRE